MLQDIKIVGSNSGDGRGRDEKHDKTRHCADNDLQCQVAQEGHTTSSDIFIPILHAQ